MMEQNFSISYIMPNLLLGLCKKSKSLLPYSAVFHEQLGYELFKFELSFQLTTKNRIQPDAILFTKKYEHSLLFEWTEALEVSPRKQNQRDHYANITSADLANFAAIPPRASSTFDIVYTVKPEAVDSFSTDIAENSQPFPILALAQSDNKLNLTKIRNNFREENTDKFFTGGVSVAPQQLPRYIPFSLESSQPRELVNFVVQHFVHLLTRGENSFTLPEFCEGLISQWKFIGSEKQIEISKKVKGILNNLVNKKWASQLANKVNGNLPSWTLYPDVFNKNPRSYRKLFISFIAEVKKETYQPGFDF